MNPTIPSHTTIDLRQRIVGLDEMTPLLNGRFVPYTNLDNAGRDCRTGQMKQGKEVPRKTLGEKRQ